MNNNTVSFSQNGHEIKDTYLKIINNAEDKLKWLIITNDDKNELFIEETGESLKDFVDSLKEDSAKVRYGICKTIPPGSDVEKLLFIGYCSDYLPIKFKMSFMKNIQIVRDDLFNNYHVLMEIRDESDLSYEAISKRLGDAAGARYSIQTGNSKGTLLHSGSSVKLPQKVIPSRSVSKPSPVPAKKVSPAPEVTKKEVVEPPKKGSPAPAAPPKKASPAPAGPPKTSPVPPVKKEAVVPPKLHTPAAKEASDDEDGWSEPPLEEKEVGHKGSYTTSSWKPIGKVDLKKVIAEEKAKVDPRLVKENTTQGFVAKRKIPTPEPEVESEEEVAEVEEPKPKKEEVVEKKSEAPVNKEEPKPVKKEEPAPVKKEEVVEKKPEIPLKKEVAKEASPEVKTDSDRKADIEAYLAKMSKKSGTSSMGLKKAEEKEVIPEAKPPTAPARSTESASSFTPQIIKPKPAVRSSVSQEFNDEVKVSKDNIKKYGIPLPGMHVEEPVKNEEPVVVKKEESDNDGWSDEEESAPVKKEAPVPAKREVPVPVKKEEPKPVKKEEPVPVKKEEPKPVKKEENDNDGWSDEEEEVEDKKPALSLTTNEDKKTTQAPPPPARAQSVTPEPKKETRAVPPPPPARATPPAGDSKKARAIHAYEADESNEISFKKDEVLTNIDEKYEEWWSGTNEAGETGVFPANYVKKI